MKTFPGCLLGGVINCAGVGMAMTTVNKKGAHDMGTFDFVCKINLYGTFSVSSKAAAIMSKQAKDDDGEIGNPNQQISLAQHQLSFPTVYINPNNTQHYNLFSEQHPNVPSNGGLYLSRMSHLMAAYLYQQAALSMWPPSRPLRARRARQPMPLQRVAW